MTTKSYFVVAHFFRSLRKMYHECDKGNSKLRFKDDDAAVHQKESCDCGQTDEPEKTHIQTGYYIILLLDSIFLHRLHNLFFSRYENVAQWHAHNQRYNVTLTIECF